MTWCRAVGIVDLELGRFDTLTYQDWITDTTVDDEHGWGYLQDVRYKPLRTLIHYLVDNVSKNGYLLLNVGPMPNGEIPEQSQRNVYWRWASGWKLMEKQYTAPPLGRLMAVAQRGWRNQAISWKIKEVQYTAKDIRFTARDDVLYAICLGWPTEPVLIEELKNLYPGEVHSVSMLGIRAGAGVVPHGCRPEDQASGTKALRSRLCFQNHEGPSV